MAGKRHITLLVAVAASLGGASASAHDDADKAKKADPLEYTDPLPPTFEGGGAVVEEKLGAVVPLDARFETQDGKAVRLGDVLSGEVPTILTFNYSDCPGLCNQQLTGLTAALPGLAEPGPAKGLDKDAAFRVGPQFRIVTISLEPNEKLEKLSKMRDRYIDRLVQSPGFEGTRDQLRAGWTFLNGDQGTIARVANAVGFKYTYITDRAEWAHPAALIFLSTRGAVTRYVYGVQFENDVMRESVVKAGLAESATAVGFMTRCYHFDPSAKDHSAAGLLALKLGAAGFLVLVLTGLGILHFVRKAQSSPVSFPRSPQSPPVKGEP